MYFLNACFKFVLEIVSHVAVSGIYFLTLLLDLLIFGFLGLGDLGTLALWDFFWILWLLELGTFRLLCCWTFWLWDFGLWEFFVLVYFWIWTFRLWDLGLWDFLAFRLFVFFVFWTLCFLTTQIIKKHFLTIYAAITIFDFWLWGRDPCSGGPRSLIGNPARPDDAASPGKLHQVPWSKPPIEFASEPKKNPFKQA